MIKKALLIKNLSKHPSKTVKKNERKEEKGLAKTLKMVLHKSFIFLKGFVAFFHMLNGKIDFDSK